MNVENCNGTIQCHSWNELENLIWKSSSNPFDDIWISRNSAYPCLAILLNGKDACVHYFLNDNGDMWQSVGYGNKDVTFLHNGEESDMPADCIISLDKAIDCAKQFYLTSDLPNCIEWQEL